MKALAILLLACATWAQGNPMEDEGGRFRVEFPRSAGWSPVREFRPNAQSIQWTARNEGTRKLFLFSVVSSPLPHPEAPFEEQAAEWKKGVEQTADAIDSERWLLISGVPAYELTGRITNAGEPYFFLRYLMQVGHFTYQVTVIAAKRFEPADVEVADFLASIRIEPEREPAGADPSGAEHSGRTRPAASER
jgi:hypothetical protein